MKRGFNRTVSWNKYKSEITTQPKNDLEYMTDLKFRNINGLFVFSLESYFDKYYMPLVEIKDFNALIHNNPFIDQSEKNNKCMNNLSKCQERMIIKQETY